MVSNIIDSNINNNDIDTNNINIDNDIGSIIIIANGYSINYAISNSLLLAIANSYW